MGGEARPFLALVDLDYVATQKSAMGRQLAMHGSVQLTWLTPSSSQSFASSFTTTKSVASWPISFSCTHSQY